MEFSNGRLLIFAKAPVLGEAKTRLIPALGAAGAAALHERMCHAALELATTARLAPVELWCHPDTHHAFFSTCHTMYGVDLHEQRGADLGARMRNAFDHALASSRYAVIIGTDCPDLTEDDLQMAFRALGPAHLPAQFCGQPRRARQTDRSAWCAPPR